MKHIVVDLEMNKVAKNREARHICTDEVIEIGAVMLDEKMQEISSFRTYVKPEYCDGITHKITKLTGITDAMVENAPRFSEAFRMFTNWCIGTGDEITLYAWSDTDYNQIKKEIILKNYITTSEEDIIIQHEWNDFQKEFDEHFHFEHQVSLHNALSMAGLDFSGREHDALDDARNTAELLQVFRDKKLFQTTLKKVEEAMNPTPVTFCIGSRFDFSKFMVSDIVSV